MLKPPLWTLFSAILILANPSASAQGSGFTHQGRLEADGAPAQGTYDLMFAVYAAASGGTAAAGPLSVANVEVAGGVFTVRLDFGTTVFTGPARWLEMGVRRAGSGAAYTTLSPRQEITPAPYAIYAGNAATATAAEGVVANGVGTLALANRAVTSAKIDDRTIQAVDLSLSLLDGTFWKLTGNAGTAPGVNYLGTTDNQALEARVNNTRALRLEPAASGPNVIGGASGNAVVPGASGAGILAGNSNLVSGSFAAIGGGVFNRAASHAFVGGGWSNLVHQPYAVIAGGSRNLIERPGGTGQFGTIGGGLGNAIESFGSGSTIAGGQFNRIEWANSPATIGGGNRNRIDSDLATIGGGEFNRITNGGNASTISGGRLNTVEKDFATIGGGSFNRIDRNGDVGTIGGGFQNTLNSRISVIGGGFNNATEPGADYSIIGGGNNNSILASAAACTIAGGSNNTIQVNALSGTISGGRDHTIGTSATFGSIGGGANNQLATLIVGGEFASTNAPHYSTISGGQSNVVQSGDWATVPGGRDNLAGGNYSFAAGRRARAVHNGSFVWADDTDADFASTAAKQFAVRADNGVLIQSVGTALDLRGGGALRVAGAGLGTATPAFTHRAAAANITGGETRLDHPHCNGRPNAILLVTHVFNPAGISPGTRNDHPVGVYYTGTRWAIYNLDGAAMPAGASFNVLVVQP